MKEKTTRDEILTDLKKFWKEVDQFIPGIYEKFNNVNGKTSQYDVPDALWTKRTSRTNRVLLRWQIVKQNKCLQSINNLNQFENGVCIEFINGEADQAEDKKMLPLKNYLKGRIGSDEQISAIETIRSVDGDSGANEARKFIEKTPKIISKYQKDLIVRKEYHDYNHEGNEDWEGKYFFLVKGGSNISYESHNEDPMLFNPAIEYANKIVCGDIYMVLSYFALNSDWGCIEQETKDSKAILIKRQKVNEELIEVLREIKYQRATLEEYCNNHICISDTKGKKTLYDPVTLDIISIDNFGKYTDRKIDLCHDEPAANYKFVIDDGRLLSAARPTNVFWGFRNSNLIQQNYTLQEYIDEEKKRISKRAAYKK